MAELGFCVPLIPPSVNHYVKHTHTSHYVTEEAKAVQRQLRFSLNKQVPHEYYAIEIYVNLAKGQKVELRESSKVILNRLVEGGADSFRRGGDIAMPSQETREAKLAPTPA